MEKMDIISVLGALALVITAIVLAAGMNYSLDTLTNVQELIKLKLWIDTFLLAFLVMVGMYVLSFTTDRRIYYGTWALLIVLGLVMLNPSQLDDLVILSIIIGSVLMYGKKVRRLREVWGKVRSERGLSSIVFLLLVSLIILWNAQHFNDLFIDNSLAWINSMMPSTAGLGTMVDKMIPMGITEQDLNYINNYLASQVPNWDQLPQSQREELINKMEQTVLEEKNLLRNVLKKSLSNTKVQMDRETFIKLIESNPRMEKLINYVFVIVILTALAVFSIITEIASLFALLILLIPEYLRIKDLPPEEKREC